MYHDFNFFITVYPDAPEVDTPIVLEFGAYNVAVMIQWTNENTSILSYTLDIVPCANITEIEAGSVQLQVLYNTIYNVSIISTLCGVNSAVTSVMLNYGKFYKDTVRLLLKILHVYFFLQTQLSAFPPYNYQ